MDVAARRESKRPAPYAPRRPRRSSRLGNHDPVDLDDDDDDKAAGGGLFSRLLSFFPLGAKKPTTVEEDEPALDDETDKPELETSQESLDSALDAAPKPVDEPAEPAQNGHVASPAKSPVKATTRSPPSKRSDKKQTSPVLTKSMFGNGTDTRKALAIEPSGADKGQFAFPRVTGRRRSKPPSPTVAESPLAVIKRKKPISFEEYERLSTQLLNLVEPTPQNALALTRSALSTALESRAPSDPAETVRDRRELSVAALPSVKRARPNDGHLPITLPREDRLVRKPKPSRLLTGTKRDTASRSAYSAAVAEKILSTLNKIQAPLDKEAQKPTPSTSLSWAKHHLAVTSQDNGKSNADAPMEADEEIPPTASIPKVVLKSVAAEKHSNAPSTFTMSPVFSFPKSQGAIAKSVDSTKVSQSSAEGSTSAVPQKQPDSVQSSVHAPDSETKEQVGQYSFTLPKPADSPAKSPEIDNVLFFFTPPPALREPPKRSPGQKAVVGLANLSTAPFSFMPASPKVRPESLTKSVPTKPNAPEISAMAPSTNKASSTNPLARFLQSDVGSWRCPTCAVMNGAHQSKCPCCETVQPASTALTPKKPAIDSSSSNLTSGSNPVNPLARFLQLEPGSWKCPGCAVTNGSKYSKCPCCEAEKPVENSSSNEAVKTSSEQVPSGATSFAFGVSGTTKSSTSESNHATSSSLKFGVQTTSTGGTSGGFAFSTPSSTSSMPPVQPTGGFNFGVPSKKSTSDAPKPSGFSFGVQSSESAELVTPSNKRKSDVDADQNEKKRTTATHSMSMTGSGFTFSFGASATSGSSAPDAGAWSEATEDKEKAKTTSFSFGSTTSAEEAPTKPAFSFGVKESTTPQKSAIPSFLSPGSSSKQSASKEVKEPTATSSSFSAPSTVSKTASEESTDKTFEAKALLNFGSAAPGSKTHSSTASTTNVAPDAKPTFTFGGGSSSTAPGSTKSFTFGSGKDEMKATTSASSAPFGQSLATEPKTDSAPKPDSASKAPVFEFGSKTAGSSNTSSTTSITTPSVPPSFSFGSSSGDSNSKKAAGFSFGAPLVDSTKKADLPAFTFGAPPQPVTSFGSTTAPSFGAEKIIGSVTPFGSSASSSSGFGATSTGFGSTQSTSTSFTTTSAGFGSVTAPTTAGFSSTTSGGFGSSTSAGLTSTTSIGFGAPTSTGFGPSSSTGFGSTTTAGFGSTTPTGFGSTTSSGFGSTTSTGFGSTTSFGSTSTSTAFGSTPVSTPSFGNTQAAIPGAPAFSFGASTATSQPAFGFSAAPTSSAFSTPSTDAFGSASQATGFGSASSGGFGSTASTPAFGAPQAHPFGSTAPSSSGFGAPTSSSSFGGNAFGSSAPAAGGFGVPTPTPSPAFGSSFGTPNASFGASGGTFGATPSPASSAFGAIPSPAFGGPATPSFGAPLTPAFGGTAPAAGFGRAAPPGDGFSMGAAPPKGRRILKAKSRTKR